MADISANQYFIVTDRYLLTIERDIESAVTRVNFADNHRSAIIGPSYEQPMAVALFAALECPQRHLPFRSGHPDQVRSVRICQHLVVSVGVFSTAKSHVTHAMRWDYLCVV